MAVMPTATDLALRRDLAANRPLQTARIPLSKLRVHARHIRQDMGDLTELAASLEHDGQHQMIKVERRGDYFQILDGHRRFAAATIAGLRRLDAEIVPAVSTAEALALMLTTGVHTKPLLAVERTRAVRALVDDEGTSVAEVAARCGVTPATIRRWYQADEHLVEDAAGTGLAGVEPSTSAAVAAAVAALPRPRRAGEHRRKPTTVGVTRLTGLADQWADRCESGLSAHDAQNLLAEIRALAAGQFS